MQRPFGHTLSLTLSGTRNWLGLGPGWAAIGAALSSGYSGVDIAALLQPISLWILVDPIMGTLWELSVEHGLWRRVTRANLPAPPAQGFSLPYAQPGSMAGHTVILCRRYRLWWTEQFWPSDRAGVTTFGVGLILALIVGRALNPNIFWLIVLAVSLTLLAGLTPAPVASVAEAGLQSLVQFFLPWIMGAVLWSTLSPLSLGLGLAYWAVYLGGLKMFVGGRRAEWLYFLGQVTAIMLLLAWRLLPGVAVLSVMLAAQLLIRTNYRDASDLVRKSQTYLVISLLVAALSLGSL